MISHRLLLKMKKGGGGGGEGDALSARLRPRDSGGGMFGDVEEEEGDDESLDAWMAARMPLEGKASRRRRRKAKRAEGGAVWAAGNDDVRAPLFGSFTMAATAKRAVLCAKKTGVLVACWVEINSINAAVHSY